MKRPVVVLATILFVIPAVLILYRIFWLRYPLFPSLPGSSWQILTVVRVRSDQEKIDLRVGLPHPSTNRVIVEEQVISGGLDFAIESDETNRFGVWSGTIGSEEETLIYRSNVVVKPGIGLKEQPPELGSYPHDVTEEERVLAERLVGRWLALNLPARLAAVSAAFGDEWGDPWSEIDDLTSWSAVKERRGNVVALKVLLRAAAIPARKVEGVRLGDTITSRTTSWVSLYPETGAIFSEQGLLLPLTVGEVSPVRVSSGMFTGIHWSISRQVVSSWILQFERIKRSDRLLDRWSLFHLPPEFQETFRILLLVPIGALMISALRNLVGFVTFGTFMPVLMALAFRNTGLVYGLAIFAGLVLVGYVLRRGMDRLRPLLVPRLSLLLTLVIIFLTLFALIGSNVGLREFMAVGLLPIVILTMTIERFFVLVEEAGTREGLKTALGSAAVAVLVYWIIRWEPLQLTFFVFPELVLAMAGVQLLLGRYVGFRISELFRFRELGRP